MKYLTFSLATIVIFLLGLRWWEGETRNKKNQEDLAYWKDKAFKTDTVFSNTTYIEAAKELARERAKQDTVPPKETIIYKEAELPPGYLEFQNKVLAYIDSTKGVRTEIKTPYITQFPKADKLISGKFRADTLSLDVLGINGQIRKDIFPVNYSKFNYDYYDNSMHASENKTRAAQNNQNKSLFLYNGTNLEYKHDFLQGNHQIELNTGFNFWKLRLGGYTQYNLNSVIRPSKLEGGVKVGARLF